MHRSPREGAFAGQPPSARKVRDRSAAKAAVLSPSDMRTYVWEQLESAPAPAASQCCAGFRVWRVLDGSLQSPYRHERWDQPLLKATCRVRCARATGGDVEPAPPHRAPHPDCRCGIYVSDVPNLNFSQVDFRGVTGIVTVWGALVSERHGVRAEYARIAALASYSHWSARQKKAVAEVARRLEADVIDFYELAEAADRYGTPLAARPHPSAA